MYIPRFAKVLRDTRARSDGRGGNTGTQSRHIDTFPTEPHHN